MKNISDLRIILETVVKKLKYYYDVVWLSAGEGREYIEECDDRITRKEEI